MFDPGTGTETHRLVLSGNLRPEAFSVDGTLIFALDYRGDHYRVQTINLASGERYDTSDRDKVVQPEDMHGSSVRGVMSADRTLLATLYRDPGNAKEPAFVHVLDLEHGWSYCADLPTTVRNRSARKRRDRAHAESHRRRRDHPLVAGRGDLHRAGPHARRQAGHRPSSARDTVALDRAPFRSITGFEHVIAALPVL